MPLEKSNTPYERLLDISMSDRGPDQGVEYMTKVLQDRWPGKYCVEWSNKEQRHVIKFVDPQEETLFLLKWKK